MTRLRGLLSQRLVRAGLASYAFTVLTLAVNLLSGIVVARALGPEGRGVTVAVVMVTQIVGQAASLGVQVSLSYHAAREPERVPALYGTWAALLVPIAIVAIACAELLLPVLFAAQDDEALRLGRLFVLCVVLVLGMELHNGLLLGTYDFSAFNAVRFVQPAAITASYVVLWALDSLTVESALIVWAAATGLVVLAGAARLLRRVGIARPQRALARRTASYGLRAHGDALAGTLNVRLDLIVLPAFVAAAGVGLYSIAANVSLIVTQFATVLASIVLPAAARDEERAPGTVLTALQASMGFAALVAAVIFLVAEPALRIVYGGDFTGAAESLRILLPGAVLLGAASVLAAGINAAGSPLRATLNQLAGAVVTVAGLLIFVPDGGITAAAIVSTVAYGTVFAGNLLVYRHLAGFTWRELVRPHPIWARSHAGASGRDRR